MTETTPDMSGIVDMDASGNVTAAPEDTEYTEIDLDGPISKPDPPGIRKQYHDSDDDELSAQLRTLREQSVELGKHANRTSAHVHERAEEAADFARRRIDAMLRDLAHSLVGRAEGTVGVRDELVAALASDPKLTKRLHDMIDALPVAAPDRQPRERELSLIDAETLRSELAELRDEMAARKWELNMRAARRDTYRAQLAEHELEASLKSKKGK